VRSRRGPRRKHPAELRADKAYHSADIVAAGTRRRRLDRPAGHRVLRTAPAAPLGDRAVSWLFGYRRLTIRYERKGSHLLAFLGLAAALTCCQKRAELTT
jgi:hypothetical protein